MEAMSATATTLGETTHRQESGMGMQTVGSAAFDVEAALASPMAALRQAEALERSLTAGKNSGASQRFFFILIFFDIFVVGVFLKLHIGVTVKHSGKFDCPKMSSVVRKRCFE